MTGEVCLKHRKIRREIILRVRVHHRTGSGVCFHLIHAAIVQQQDIWLPIRECRCESGWPHQFFQQQRGSQVVRQRSHTPCTAGSNPASATNSQTINRVRGRQQSASLGTRRHPGRHRGTRPLFERSWSILLQSVAWTSRPSFNHHCRCEAGRLTNSLARDAPATFSIPP